MSDVIMSSRGIPKLKTVSRASRVSLSRCCRWCCCWVYGPMSSVNVWTGMFGRILPRKRLCHFGSSLFLHLSSVSTPLQRLSRSVDPTQTTRNGKYGIWDFGALQFRCLMERVDIKGKGRADPASVIPDSLETQHWRPARESERWTATQLWRESRKRAQADRDSWDYSACGPVHITHTIDAYLQF